jgi:AraC-like DNA-binding protein
MRDSADSSQATGPITVAVSAGVACALDAATVVDLLPSVAMHNATIESWPPSDSKTPAPDIGRLVWGAQSRRRLADDVVSTLRSLDLTATLWDEAQQAGEVSAPCELVVADSASLRLIAARKGAPRSDGTGAADQAGTGGLAPGALRRVVEHIEANLGERIDIRELASLAGLSECQFARAFKQSVGMPPHRYVVSRRVAVGAALIERTERSMTDVALSIGFSDHSHFTRTFGRVTGETPSAYRRSRRSGCKSPG